MSPAVAFHDMKIWPPFLTEIRTGAKKNELREDDRAFDVGDILILREYLPTEDDLDHLFEALIQLDDEPEQFAATRLMISEAVDQLTSSLPTAAMMRHAAGLAEKPRRGEMTGEVELVRVTHVLRGWPGILAGHALLSFERVRLVYHEDDDEDGPGPA